MSFTADNIKAAYINQKLRLDSTSYELVGVQLSPPLFSQTQWIMSNPSPYMNQFDLPIARVNEGSSVYTEFYNPKFTIHIDGNQATEVAIGLEGSARTLIYTGYNSTYSCSYYVYARNDGKKLHIEWVVDSQSSVQFTSTFELYRYYDVKITLNRTLLFSDLGLLTWKITRAPYSATSYSTYQEVTLQNQVFVGGNDIQHAIKPYLYPRNTTYNLPEVSEPSGAQYGFVTGGQILKYREDPTYDLSFTSVPTVPGSTFGTDYDWFAKTITCKDLLEFTLSMEIDMAGSGTESGVALDVSGEHFLFRYTPSSRKLKLYTGNSLQTTLGEVTLNIFQTEILVSFVKVAGILNIQVWNPSSGNAYQSDPISVLYTWNPTTSISAFQSTGTGNYLIDIGTIELKSNKSSSVLPLRSLSYFDYSWSTLLNDTPQTPQSWHTIWSGDKTMSGSSYSGSVTVNTNADTSYKYRITGTTLGTSPESKVSAETVGAASLTWSGSTSSPGHMVEVWNCEVSVVAQNSSVMSVSKSFSSTPSGTATAPSVSLTKIEAYY